MPKATDSRFKLSFKAQDALCFRPLPCKRKALALAKCSFDDCFRVNLRSPVSPLSLETLQRLDPKTRVLCTPVMPPPPPSSLGKPLPCQPFRGWMKKPEKEGSAGTFLSYPSLSLLGTGEGKCSRIKCHISINHLLAQSPFG